MGNDETKGGVSMTTSFTGSSQVTHIFQYESAPVIPALGKHAIVLVVDGSSEHSTTFVNEVLSYAHSDQLHGSDVYILDVSAPGAAAFASRNEWLLNLPALPYVVIYRHGLRTESFPAFHASYLLARLQRLALAPSTSGEQDVIAAHIAVVAAD
jgi:hypothetical protein